MITYHEDPDYDSLDVDAPCTITHEGKRYSSVAALYVALARPEVASSITPTTSAQEAWALLGDDPHDENAMNIALMAKYFNPEAAKPLLALEPDTDDPDEWEIQYFCDDTFWGYNLDYQGNNYIGVTLADLRDRLIREQEIRQQNARYVIKHVFPGHVAKSSYGPHISLLKVPDTTRDGTTFAAIPTQQMMPTRDLVKSGKHKGEPYIDIYLVDDNYRIAYRNPEGELVPNLGNDVWSAKVLSRQFEMARSTPKKPKDRQAKPSPHAVRMTTDPTLVATATPEYWPRLAFALGLRKDAGLSFIVANLDTRYAIDISSRPALDHRGGLLIDHDTICVDPTGIELVLEMAIAEGGLSPKAQPSADGKRKSFMETDSTNKVAWFTMRADPKTYMRSTDKALAEYLSTQGYVEVALSPAYRSITSPRRKATCDPMATMERMLRMARKETIQERCAMIQGWIGQGVYHARNA